MDISIVIVSYNVKEFLRGAILSVQRSLEAGGLTGEILVVDNDSADGSAAMVQVEFPNVRIHALKENLGFGRANNLAMREATGDYLLLLNPDTIVGEDTLRTMFDFMREHPEAGLAGCKLLNGDGSFQISCRRGFPSPWASFSKLFGLSRLFPKSPLFAQYNLTHLPVDQTYEIDALSGAFMLLSRQAYKATNGFDEDYFMYGEDLDLCFRTKKAGFKVFYVPTTATIHFQGESTKRSAINEINVFYEAMHIFVKKSYRSSRIFSALLRLGIFLRTVIALLKKYRAVIGLVILDYLTVAAGVLLGSRLLLDKWFGLPSEDYPFAIILPPVIVVCLLAILKSYSGNERRSPRQIVIAMPAILIGLSSLTYFFKEFPASRAVVMVVTAVTGALLLLNRLALGIADRIRWGGDNTASPSLRPTLIVGTTSEALRIAELLRRTQFLRRYEVVGFIDSSLSRLGEEPIGGIPILGDANMMGKVAREHRISEVIFASDAAPYMEMLAMMQRVSAENVSSRVNFNMVPTASEVLLGRRKIEFLAPSAESSLALMPIEYNLQRLSHRVVKRMLDIAVSGAALMFVPLFSLLSTPLHRRERIQRWLRMFRGELTLVGVAGAEARSTFFSTPGLTSLAAVAAPNDVREEDLHQFDQYYARNHTLGMDFEILLKTLVFRKDRVGTKVYPGPQ